jgi:hypothetical protein
MDIFVFSILTNFIYFCSGSLFISAEKYESHSQFYIYFIGVIIISFLSLILNFVTPLTPLINSLVYLVIIVGFIIKKKFVLKKKNLSFLLISSFITFLLIIYSTVNRPDAGLYHLPYTAIINENKIIFGLSNIHFRFGHISILQYLSAINNNYLFLENGISIPLASIISFFFIYFFYDILKVIKEKNIINLSNFFSLFIVIYIAFKIARYSEFGNDAVAHLCFFYLIHYLLKNNMKEINLNKILYISIFTFINKSTLGLIFVAPVVIFFFQYGLKIKKIFYSLFSFPVLILYLWLLKNIIVSGCAIYPIEITCIKKLPWTNAKEIANISTLSEAWSKAWPDRKIQNITMEEFNQSFNWLNAWSKKHLKYILNIIIPFTVVLLIIIILIKIKTKNITTKNNHVLDARIFLSLIISGSGTFAFFLMFPLYRYGYSYIITLISLVFILTIKNKISIKENLVIFKFVFAICFSIVIAKQGIKILINYKNSAWPNIYTLDSGGNIYPKTKINISDNFIYYLADKGDSLCMYSRSPCTTYPVKKNIAYKQKYTYKILMLN